MGRCNSGHMLLPFSQGEGRAVSRSENGEENIGRLRRKERDEKAGQAGRLGKPNGIVAV